MLWSIWASRGHALQSSLQRRPFYSFVSSLFMGCGQSTMSSPTSLQFPNHNWFKEAFGFEEADYNTTQKVFMEMQASSSDPSSKLRWLKTGNKKIVEVSFGSFVTPTVQTLREECTQLQQSLSSKAPGTRVRWQNLQASVLDLHADPGNEGAVFQAASQFNCLEFVSEEVVPEQGIKHYCHDHTQGPACAMACGPGTAFRNYLVDMEEAGKGQQRYNQINTLQPIMAKLVEYNTGESTGLSMVNGYAMVGNQEMYEMHPLIQPNRDELISLLQVGVQCDTQVTYPNLNGHLVTQVYCSAVPISYSEASADAWEPLARVVLEGAYEATLLEGVRQHLLKQQHSQKGPIPPIKVFLTLVGGGVFGNKLPWIYEAMSRAHKAIAGYSVSLDVYIVHYGEVSPMAKHFVSQMKA